MVHRTKITKKTYVWSIGLNNYYNRNVTGDCQSRKLLRRGVSKLRDLSHYKCTDSTIYFKTIYLIINAVWRNVMHPNICRILSLLIFASRRTEIIMTACISTYERKRYALYALLTTNHSDLILPTFFKLARSNLFKASNEPKTGAGEVVSIVKKRKKRILHG